MYWNFLFFGRVPSFCSQLPSYWWSLRPFSPKSPVNSSLERQAYWTSPDHLLWQHHAPIARQRVFSSPSLSAMMGFWNLNHGYIYIYVVYIYYIILYIYILLTTVGHVTSKFGNPNGHLYRIAKPFGQSNVPESFLGMSPCGKQTWQHASLRHVV